MGTGRRDGAGVGSDPGFWMPTDVEDEGARARDRFRILARPADGGPIRAVAIDALERTVADGELVWVDVDDPGSAVAALLLDRLNLGRLTVEDCLLPVRMPKLDPLPDGGAFVAVFALRLEEGDEPRLRELQPANATVSADQTRKIVREKLVKLSRWAKPPPPRGQERNFLFVFRLRRAVRVAAAGVAPQVAVECGADVPQLVHERGDLFLERMVEETGDVNPQEVEQLTPTLVEHALHAQFSAAANGGCSAAGEPQRKVG